MLRFHPRDPAAPSAYGCSLDSAVRGALGYRRAVALGALAEPAWADAPAGLTDSGTGRRVARVADVATAGGEVIGVAHDLT